MKKLGIIGGLGPLATAYFFKRVTEFQKAEQDQDHFEVVIDSRPSIPKRVEYILGNSEISPLPALVDVAKGLERNGAQILALPCMTAHYFYNEISSQTQIPLLNAIRETGIYLKENHIKQVGILGTKATLRSGFIQTLLEEYGIHVIIPDEKSQELIQGLIGELKAGEKNDGRILKDVADGLCIQGAEVNLLACTELSILNQISNLEGTYLDMMDVLAMAAVRECGTLRENVKLL